MNDYSTLAEYFERLKPDAFNHVVVTLHDSSRKLIVAVLRAEAYRAALGTVGKQSCGTKGERF